MAGFEPANLSGVTGALYTLELHPYKFYAEGRIRHLRSTANRVCGLGIGLPTPLSVAAHHEIFLMAPGSSLARVRNPGFGLILFWCGVV